MSKFNPETAFRKGASNQLVAVEGLDPKEAKPIVDSLVKVATKRSEFLAGFKKSIVEGLKSA
jgi:hypothetical protein